MTVLHAENDLERESFFLQNQKVGQQGVDPLPTAEVQAGVEGGRLGWGVSRGGRGTCPS